MRERMKDPRATRQNRAPIGARAKTATPPALKTVAIGPEWIDVMRRL